MRLIFLSLKKGGKKLDSENLQTLAVENSVSKQKRSKWPKSDIEAKFHMKLTMQTLISKSQTSENCTS
jgi:hypothetical protein